MNRKGWTVVCFLFVLILFGLGVFLYDQQYNSKGLGRYLCIEINESGINEIESIDDVKVLTYNLEMPYMVSIMGDNVFLDEAIKKRLIVIDDLCKYADTIEQKRFEKKDSIVYSFENYQVVITDKKCLIAPLDVETDSFREYLNGM